MSNLDLGSSPQLVGGDEVRIWVISDIQPTSFENAERMLRDAVDDVLALGEGIDAVCVLGDAYRGADEELIHAVAQLFIDQLARLKVPICYLLGNHEMDLCSANGRNWFPLLDLAREAGWELGRLDEFFFARRFGGFLVVFLGDHAETERKWWTTHGHVREEVDGCYPYGEAEYRRLSEAIEEGGLPTVIAAHYAFPGGQKPSGLVARMLPLPPNVKLVLHGHAHIGDLVWNKDDPWERLHAVEGQVELEQINVSALESERSPGSHSAFLELGKGEAWRLRMRCHRERRWAEGYEGGLKDL